MDRTSAQPQVNSEFVKGTNSLKFQPLGSRVCILYKGTQSPPERLERIKWLLLTVETEANGDLKSTNERG
jgi:hypothetical protein